MEANINRIAVISFGNSSYYHFCEFDQNAQGNINVIYDYEKEDNIEKIINAKNI